MKEIINNNKIENQTPIEEEKENPTKIFTLEEAEKARLDGDEMREKLFEVLKSTEGEEKAKKECNDTCAEVCDKAFSDSADEKAKANVYLIYYALCKEKMDRYKKHTDKIIYDNRDRIMMVLLLEKLMEARMKKREKMTNIK